MSARRANSENRMPLVIMLLLVAVIGCFIFMREKPEEKKESAEVQNLAITDMDTFKDFAGRVSRGEEYFDIYVSLESDLDFADIDFNGIRGNFRGVFDGKGHVIKNLAIDSETTAGLFDKVSGVITNLTIDAGSINGKDFSGAIAALLTHEGSVINCCNYADVTGNEAGGICGRAYGRLINCVNIVEKSAPGAKRLTSDNRKADIENCYLERNAEFKIPCRGDDESKTAARKAGIDNLNNRLVQLSMEYPNFTFCKWALADEYPYVYISEQSADIIASLEVKKQESGIEAATKYSLADHCYEVKKVSKLESLKGCRICYETASGKKSEIDINDDLDRVYFYADDLKYEVSLENMVKRELKNPKGPVRINLSEAEKKASESVLAVRCGYYEDSQLSGKELMVKLAPVGSYMLTGNLDGSITADISGNEDKGIILNLDNVTITAAHGPAIYTEGDAQDGNPGLSIHLMDGSTNRIDASYALDIYTADLKYDGAIFSKADISIYGDSGRLLINGERRALESKSNVVIYGGNLSASAKSDVIVAKGSLMLLGGVLNLEATDNGIDCSNVVLQGGLLTGINKSPEKCIARSNVRINGTIVAFSGDNIKPGADSENDIVKYEIPKNTEADSVIVMCSTDDVPLVAFKYTGEQETITFSYPGVKYKDVSFYVADTVEGTWNYNVCTDITGIICE